MGLTIHFQGHLRSSEDYEKVLQKCKDFASNKSVEVKELEIDSHTLIRVRDGQVVEYESPIRVITFQPHEKCDSLILEFDSELWVQQFCKTQFAGIPTHIEVIGFLRGIEPFFNDFQVNDEGDYWNTNSVQRLEQKFEDYKKALELTEKLIEYGIIPDIVNRQN